MTTVQKTAVLHLVVGMFYQTRKARGHNAIGFENQYDLPVVFQCPRNNYINGMGSVHDNGAEDRIWKFYCCQLPDIHMFDCSFTDWTNVFDGAQNFNSPDGLVMKGMDSYHDNNFEDRRFKYELCTPYVMDGLIVVG
ncbi:hypothetical protein DPMN_103838 [Dreissena polymorpha]|uniref:Uncharacterized protein n=1 Tax=Dreissena polymorpha TaxID=45954 RepID=A0A9D4HAU0_DREPO|nr:hypothetical protein DPMN_103838 [Dreissena polymorpha]